MGARGAKSARMDGGSACATADDIRCAQVAAGLSGAHSRPTTHGCTGGIFDSGNVRFLHKGSPTVAAGAGLLELLVVTLYL